MSPSRRRLRLAALLVLCSVVLLIGVALFAVHNAWATRALVRQGLAVVPVNVGRIEGTLGGRLVLHDVAVITDATHVTAGRVAVELALAELFARRLALRVLEFDDIALTPKPSDAAPSVRPFELPELEAPVPMRIDALRVRNLRVTTLPDFPVERIAATLTWQDHRLSITALDVDAPFATLDGELTLALDANAPVAGELAWHYAQPAASGALTLGGSLHELELAHRLESPLLVATSGTVEVLGQVDPLISLTHVCTASCAPPEVDADVRDVTLTHRGTLAKSTVSLDSRVRHARLAPTDVSARGRWLDGSLLIDTLSARGEDVALSGTGQFAITDAPAGTLAGTLAARIERLNAATVYAGVNGELSGNVNASVGGEAAWAVTLSELVGTINGYALAGHTQVAALDDGVAIRDAVIELGDNRADATGTWTPASIDLDAKLALSNLAQIDARLGGEIGGHVALAGSPQRPQITAQLSGRSLAAQDASLGSVDLDVTLDATGALSGRAQAAALQVAEHDIGQVSVALAGTRDAPSMDLDWRAGPSLSNAAVNAAVQVVRAESGWQIDVERADATTDVLGRWELDAPFAARLADDNVVMDANTWRHGAAYVTLDEVRAGNDDLTLRATLEQFPLATLDLLLPESVRVRGTARAQLDVTRRGEQWRGNVSYAQQDTVLRLRNSAASRRVNLERVAFNAIVQPEVVRAVLDVTGTPGIRLTAQAKADATDELAQSALGGTLRAELGDLAWLAGFVPGIESLAGEMVLDGALGGRVGAPAVSGTLAVRRGDVALADLGIRLEDVSLDGELGDTLSLRGQARSGGGTLTLDGSLREPWRDTRSGTLNVRGDNVQVLNDARYNVRVSPDLDLTVAPDSGARIAGRVDVPFADIRIEAVPQGVVAASDDIQMAGRELDRGTALPVSGDVALAFGDDVHVFALGLDADVSGNVRLQLADGRAPRLDGRLALDDGTFAAYGQSLTIERGNVIYAGPIDNPTLDLRAVRRISNADEEVTAGVSVSGAAQAPDIALYAEPAMSQTDALSYLLLGRAADDTSGVEGEALSQAALAFGMSRSSSVTQQLARGLGLDELSVAAGSVDTAELVAGKQINDRLYLRYTYGVFSNLGAILLRYRLSRRLTLEAGSADAQSLDLLYTIEK